MLGLVGMREDMEYIGEVLDELGVAVKEASGVPMRKGRAVVDRADLLAMLDELRGVLPEELSEAEAIRRECTAVVTAAEEEARRIIEEAHERAEAKVLDTELYRRSQRRGGEAGGRGGGYARAITGRFRGLSGAGDGPARGLVSGFDRLGRGIEAGAGKLPRAPLPDAYRRAAGVYRGERSGLAS